MKKVKLLLGIFCMVLISASCCNSKKENATPCGGPQMECKKGDKKSCAPKCEMSEEQKAFFEKWKNFDNLPAEEQKELIAKRKACIEKREAEKKAAIEEFEAKWANFDNLTIAEQKELLEKKDCFMAPCGREMMRHGKGRGECPMMKKECNKGDK